MVEATHLQRRVYRTGIARVKSGCRTCKIRKVKCDEGFPACYRCISTGRVCDGYGIRGGGGNFYGDRNRSTGSKCGHITVQRIMPPTVLASGTVEEKSYFEWFKCTTAPKLPGTFVSGFWTPLLFQASSSEPAVLHAVLALSAVHKTGTFSDAEEREPFALRHYVEAIGCLRDSSLGKSKLSLRPVLITCIIFVYLELFRGHFETAELHLEKGVRLLNERTGTENGDMVLRQKALSDPVDCSIVEAFSRLVLQVEFFRHTYSHSCLMPRAAIPEYPALLISSLKDAWQGLEHLLYSIFHLTEQARQQVGVDFKASPGYLALFAEQSRIQTQLAQWLDEFEAFIGKMSRSQSGPGQAELIHGVLRTYHTMAVIMTEAALRPGDETVYDSYTSHFNALIIGFQKLFQLSKQLSPLQPLRGRKMDMSRSIIDMGCIPPIYYTAIKCRVRAVRLRAIRLLECTYHREGFWDAQTVACVARKVMALEEGYLYEFSKTDNFALFSSPDARDLLMPLLPASRRMAEVKVVLSGSPMDRIVLSCKRSQQGMDRKILASEFDVHSQTWTDGYGHCRP